jgi:hypothetical protein
VFQEVSGLVTVLSGFVVIGGMPNLVTEIAVFL